MGNVQTSQARIEANRRNARKSTGPKTVEGKAKSRRNGLVHGLAGAGVVTPEHEAEALADRLDAWVEVLRPRDELEATLVETIAFETFRVDRCRVEERLARGLLAWEARVCWDDQRRAEAAKFGRLLGADPEQLTVQLRGTAAGCDWMIARWVGLGRVLDDGELWDHGQIKLALDLLGVAEDLRSLDHPLCIPEGCDVESYLREIIDGQLAELRERKSVALDEADAARREAAEAGLLGLEDRHTTLARRYEAASSRRIKWAFDLLSKARAGEFESAEDRRDRAPSFEGSGAEPMLDRKVAESAPGPIEALEDRVGPTSVPATAPVANRTQPAGIMSARLADSLARPASESGPAKLHPPVQAVDLPRSVDLKQLRKSRRRRRREAEMALSV